MGASDGLRKNLDGFGIEAAMIGARARLKRAVNLHRTMTDGQANIFHVGKLTPDILECSVHICRVRISFSCRAKRAVQESQRDSASKPRVARAAP